MTAGPGWKRAVAFVGILIPGLLLWSGSNALTAYSGLQVLPQSDTEFRQRTDSSCGPAALRYLFNRKFGVDVSEYDLSVMAGTTERGTTLYGLKKASEDLGYSAVAWRWQVEKLDSLELPALVYFHRWHHYGVITDSAPHGVVVFDPGKGTYLTLTHRALEYFWDGTVLVVSSS